MKFLTICALLAVPILATSQNSNAKRISGQEGGNPITVAVPFLNFAPDSRGSALGDAGVATSADPYSVHWNNAKLAFIEGDMGASFSYSPWLGNIVDDMSLNYLTFYRRISTLETLGASLRYFDLGEIQLTDESGASLGIENPREASFDLTYSRKLSERISVAVTGRFIWSNLSGNITSSPNANPGTSVAIDLGYYYTIPLMVAGRNSDLSFGAHISNLGQKITYSNDDNEDFIPANLRLGTAFKTNIDPYNSFTFALDFNKLMVPTPPTYEVDDNGDFERDANGNLIIEKGKDPNRPLISGTFGSFTDAPGGFNEEIKEFTISSGIEYWYRDMAAARIGYFHEHEQKGARKYFTAGIGFRYQIFGIDVSYLIAQEQNHPLGDTMRISIVFDLDGYAGKDSN